MFLAVKHLVQMGHKKIGYLRSGVDINSFEERFRRGMDAMRYFGCEEPERYVFEIGYPADNAAEGMRILLASGKDLPTAFTGDNDLVVAGAMREMISEGYSIPADMSFIGFDDRPVCEWMLPQMSSIRLPREYFGGEAVRLLIRMITKNPEVCVKTEINSELVVRESVLKM